MNHFVIFVEGIMRNNYFEFEPMVQEMLFIRYSLSRAVVALVQQSRSICAIFVEGIMRNISQVG